MPPSADVVVVGGGPAGAASALLLARAGFEVVLLDRATFPRAKPCGDCLSPRATVVLDRLGVLAAVEAQRPARLEGWRIVSPAGACFVGCFAAAARGDARLATGLALPRARLDAVLLEAAERAGVAARTGARVGGILRDARGGVAGVSYRNGDDTAAEIRARLVIGADGLRSVVARRLGLIGRPARLRKVSLTAHVSGVAEASGSAYGEMHLAQGACAGLALVTDEPDRLWNLTLVADADRFGRELARDPPAFFRRMLGSFPRLRGRLRDVAWTEPLMASGPFDRPTRAVAVDGAALVGDAAGYYDPFTGQGIYQALAGAALLAEAAEAALRAGDVSARRLRRYARRHAQLVRGARRVQHAIEWATARPALADLVIHRLRRAPAAADRLIAVTGDVAPAVSLLSPAVLLSLLILSSSREIRA